MEVRLSREDTAKRLSAVRWGVTLKIVWAWIFAIPGAVLLATVPAFAAGGIKARDVLPVGGLIAASVAPLADQAALDAHYYLAEESLLGLGVTTDAVFARYLTSAGEASLLVVVYPSAEVAGRSYRRFGGDFFSRAFDPAAARFAERIETGDWAGAALRGAVMIVVLEAPDRTSCEALLRAARKKAAAKIP